MKFSLLTKEQFEALHQDFAKYLAAQQIDAKDWEAIKTNKPQKAQEALELFSDLVWTDVLSKTKYIEHTSPNELNLFNCGPLAMHRLVVKVAKSGFDFYKDADYQWFLKHPNDKTVSYFQAQKKYDQARAMAIFELIKKGGVISQGELYRSLLKQL